MFCKIVMDVSNAENNNVNSSSSSSSSCSSSKRSKFIWFVYDDDEVFDADDASIGVSNNVLIKYQWIDILYQCFYKQRRQ